MALINFQSEKDMVDIFIEKAEVNEEFNHNMAYREVVVGNYGRIDLLVVDFDTDFVFFYIYEFKNRYVELKDYVQISRYIVAIRKYFERFEKLRMDVKATIVCTGIDKNSDIVYFAKEVEESIKLKIAEISIDGVEFSPVTRYYLSDPKFVPIEAIDLEVKAHIDLKQKYSELQEQTISKRLANDKQLLIKSEIETEKEIAIETKARKEGEF